MATHELAPGVTQISLDPIDGVNAYILGDALIDSGGKQAVKTVLKGTQGRKLTVHALTHVHPDHQGSSKVVCETLGLPYAVPGFERANAERGDFAGLSGATRRARLSARVFGGPGHDVARELSEGDELGGFTAVALPGHTPGQLGYWRERDRVLIAGDALRNISYATGRPMFAAPPWFFGVDEAETMRSIAKIAALRPALIAFGHGRPVSGESVIAAKLDAILS